jgi:hypothetical protein
VGCVDRHAEFHQLAIDSGQQRHDRGRRTAHVYAGDLLGIQVRRANTVPAELRVRLLAGVRRDERG